MKRTAAAALLATAVAGATFATVRAEGEPNGYTGKGQLVVQTTVPSFGTINLGGDIAMEERGSRLRIDVLSLGIPGTSSTISALVGTQLFPPGGFTVVYDRAGSALTVWSNAQRKYYTTAGATGTAPVQTPAAAGTGGDLFGAFAFARGLRNDSVFNVSLGLAGHQTVNGHPATGLNFQYQRTTRDTSLDLHGTLQFADDLDGVPVEISVAGKSKTFPESAFRLDFTQLVRATAPDADFAAPAGYARAATLGEVIGRTLPIPGG